MTNSVFLQTLIKLYRLLNTYYENSLCYKMIQALAAVCANSVIVSMCYRLIGQKRNDNYSDHSVCLRILYQKLDWIGAFLSQWIRSFFRVFQHSAVNAVFSGARLKNWGWIAQIAGSLGAGFFLFRLIVVGLQYGMDRKNLILNGCFFLLCVLLSFLPVVKLNEMIRGSSCFKFIAWIFSSEN